MQPLQIQILRMLNDERERNPLQTLDNQELARRIGVPWDTIRHEITYLEEKKYIETKRSHRGIRIIIMLRITATGVDLVTSEADDVHQMDVYSRYENGLHQLLMRMEPDNHRYSEALVYQQRLVENIARSRRYGDTDTSKAERAEIIDRLNELALAVVTVSFIELCNQIIRAGEPSEDLRRVQ